MARTIKNTEYKLELNWFDKQTEYLIESENSKTLNEEDTLIDELGLFDETHLFASAYNFAPGWTSILQKYFKHPIDSSTYDYQLSFRYQGEWPFAPKK